MKTKEELNALKEEVETLNKKLAELTDEELTQVNGGRYLQDLADTYQNAYTNIEYSGSDSPQTESH